jgi:hypothetical protein
MARYLVDGFSVDESVNAAPLIFFGSARLQPAKGSQKFNRNALERHETAIRPDPHLTSGLLWGSYVWRFVRENLHTLMSD